MRHLWNGAPRWWPRKKQDSNSNRKSLEFYVLKFFIPSKTLCLLDHPRCWFKECFFFLETPGDSERFLLLLLFGWLIDIITITQSPETPVFLIGHCAPLLHYFRKSMCFTDGGYKSMGGATICQISDILQKMCLF